MIELIIFALLGVAIGIVTGLVPGLHINTLIPLLLSLTFLTGNPYLFAVLIVSIAISQNFVSFIPSIFLGAPEADTSLSVLPGHRMLFEGRGYEAILLTSVGGLCSLFVTLFLVFFLSDYFKIFYEFSRPYLSLVISAIVLFMIFSEKGLKKILFAAAIILLSGLFGILVLNSPIVSAKNVLFPVFAGLFGLSNLILSVSQKSQIPFQQFDSQLKISKLVFLKSVAIGSIAGILVGFLPAVGVSQAATLVQAGKMGDARNFLVSLSSINTANEIFSLISLYLVGNPRSGASVAIERVLTELTIYDVLLLVGTISFVSGIAAILTVFLGKRIPKILARLDYKKLSISIMIFILAMVGLITGFYGLLIAFTATSIGILCNFAGIKKSNNMGILLIPSILFFANLNPLIISVLGM